MNFRKLLSIALLLLGAGGVFNIFYPEASKKYLGKFISPFAENQISKTSQKAEDLLKNVLGEKNDNQEVELSQEEILKQLKKLPAKVYEQEAVQEISKSVNEIITQKVEEIKSLPEQRLDEAKKEIKDQIYEEICGQWLKKD